MEQYNMTEGNRSALTFSRSHSPFPPSDQGQISLILPGKRAKAIALLGLILFCFIGSTTFGHNLDTLSFDSLNYSLLFEHRLMQTGEQIDFKVQLGTTNAPVYDLVGFDIDLEISNQAAFPIGFQMNLDDSWLFVSSGADTTVNHDPDEGTASLHGFRTDSTATFGHGILLQFSLICTEDNVWSDALISELTGGGLMMVDNLEKQQTSDVLPSPTPMVVWPNPAHDQVHIDLGESFSAEEICLVNGQGQTVQRITVNGHQALTMDISTIPAGVYLLQTHLKKGGMLVGSRLVVQ